MREEDSRRGGDRFKRSGQAPQFLVIVQCYLHTIGFEILKMASRRLFGPRISSVLRVGVNLSHHSRMLTEDIESLTMENNCRSWDVRSEKGPRCGVRFQGHLPPKSCGILYHRYLCRDLFRPSKPINDHRFALLQKSYTIRLITCSWVHERE